MRNGSPGYRSSPIKLTSATGSDKVDLPSDAIAYGHGANPDGIPCDVLISSSHPGQSPLDYWGLNSEQAELLNRGSHIVIEIAVTCT